MNRIAMSAIAFDAGTQIRAAIDQQIVGEYAEAMTGGAMFPPIVLFHDGNRHYLADGFHRFMAAQRIQWREIDADVRPGTIQDALWFALGANRTNGKRLTESDKKHAIVIALKTWPDRSARELSNQIGCSHQYVSLIRDQVSSTRHLAERVAGKDGKSYPASRKSEQKPMGRPPKNARATTRTERAERWDRARQMATEGYSSRQMADAFGMTLEGLREALRQKGIDVPADRVLGKAKRHNSNRILDQMILDAEHLTADVPLIVFDDLHRDRLAEWIKSLISSRDKLSAFIRRLKERSQHGEAA